MDRRFDGRGHLHRGNSRAESRGLLRVSIDGLVVRVVHVASVALLTGQDRLFRGVWRLGAVWETPSRLRRFRERRETRELLLVVHELAEFFGTLDRTHRGPYAAGIRAGDGHLCADRASADAFAVDLEFFHRGSDATSRVEPRIASSRVGPRRHRAARRTLLALRLECTRRARNIWRELLFASHGPVGKIFIYVTRGGRRLGPAAGRKVPAALECCCR